MNRANFGNIITNGTQILSVAATTASHLYKDRADRALNNSGLTKDDIKTIKTAENKKRLEEAQGYLSDNGTSKSSLNRTNLTEEELSIVRKANDKRMLDNAKKYLEGENENDVDVMLKSTIPSTEEGKQEAMKIKNDIDYVAKRKELMSGLADNLIKNPNQGRLLTADLAQQIIKYGKEE